MLHSVCGGCSVLGAGCSVNRGAARADYLTTIINNVDSDLYKKVDSDFCQRLDGATSIFNRYYTPPYEPE